MHGLYRKVGKYNKLKKKSYKCVISQVRQSLLTGWCVTVSLFSVHFNWAKWINIEYFVL